MICCFVESCHVWRWGSTWSGETWVSFLQVQILYPMQMPMVLLLVSSIYLVKGPRIDEAAVPDLADDPVGLGVVLAVLVHPD